MKVLCKNEYLHKTIHKLERVAGKNTTLPILTTILLEAKDGVFSLSATNLEVGIVIKIPSKIEKEGVVAIPARLLGGFIQALIGTNDIFLEGKRDAIFIKGGSQSAVIKGFNAQEFPIIPKQRRGQGSIVLPAQEARDAIERVISFVSLNETRPELTGVEMSFDGGYISFAATDSFRLGEARIKVEIKEGEMLGGLKSIIIPASACHELIRLIGPEDKGVTLTIQEKQLFFTLPSTILVSRLIDGKYPDYKQIIPQSTGTTAVMHAEDFLRAIKAAALFTQSSGGEIIMDISEDKGVVGIAAQSQEAGESHAELRAVIHGGAQRVVLNPRYIMDGITAIGAPFIHIGVTAGTAPILFRGGDEEGGEAREGVLYIVMPIKSR